MTQSQTVYQIVNILTQAGYRSCTLPVKVASIQFDFAAFLVGKERANDLIAVIDTSDVEARIKQKVEGLGRALDLALSRRPLTVILVGPPLRPATIEALARVSRVLTVATHADGVADSSLTDSLAILLPLNLPDSCEPVVDPMEEFRMKIINQNNQAIAEPLMQAAMISVESVREALRSGINQYLENCEGS